MAGAWGYLGVYAGVCIGAMGCALVRSMSLVEILKSQDRDLV
jgi:hypothetical protein